MKLNNNGFQGSKGLLLVNFVATILYITWWVTPYIHRNTNQIYLFIILSIWLSTALITRLMANDTKIPLILLPITAWVSYIIVLRLLEISGASWGNYYNNILFWFPIIILSFYNKYM